MKRKPIYRAPRNRAERIAEAKAAISRLEDGRRGQHGQTYQACSEAIARWQLVLDRETKL